MGSLSYSNYVIAEVDCRTVTAQATVGRYRLLFHLEFDLKKWESAQLRGYVPYINGLRATVMATGALLGVALPTQEDFLPPVDPATPGTVTATRAFALDVDRQVLEAIERRREGQDADFALEVMGTASILSLGEGDAQGTPFGPLRQLKPLLVEPRRVTASVHHRVPRSDWVELLNGVGYGRTLLFEIPWPASGMAGFSEAISHFQAAQAAFVSGYYTEAVGKLREGLDRAAEAVDVGRLDWKKIAGRSREDMSLEERFLLAWNATRHLTHPAHHGGSYSREEASYVLGMGALALSLAAGAPGVLKDREAAEQVEEIL